MATPPRRGIFPVWIFRSFTVSYNSCFFEYRIIKGISNDDNRKVEMSVMIIKGVVFIIGIALKINLLHNIVKRFYSQHKAFY